MTLLIIGLVLFLGVHSISIVAAPWRDRMAAQLGNGWRALYSLISLAGFVLIIYGYGQTRLAPQVLYVPPAWLRHVAMTVMLPVFPLLLAVYLPGRIRAATKHPMLLATKLWALAHLLANGMLADVLLFGGFLLWAGADRASFKRRVAREIKTAPFHPRNDWIAVIAGLAIYAVVVMWGHAALIGVALR